MKKPVKIALFSTLGVVVFAAGLFLQQVYTKASSDWQTSEANKAQSELAQTAQSTTNQLTNSASTDISNTIDSQISDEIKKNQDELNQLLEQYYQLKLQGLTNTDQFKQLESQIDYYKQWAFDNYKQQIDQVFANQGH